jgi:hypothetical protein
MTDEAGRLIGGTPMTIAAAMRIAPQGRGPDAEGGR